MGMDTAAMGTAATVAAMGMATAAAKGTLLLPPPAPTTLLSTAPTRRPLRPTPRTRGTTGQDTWGRTTAPTAMAAATTTAATAAASTRAACSAAASSGSGSEEATETKTTPLSRALPTSTALRTYSTYLLAVANHAHTFS